MKKSPLTILRNILCVLLTFWLMLSVPTGWLYDLGAGTGTGQGQTPGEGVRQLRRQEEVQTLFLTGSPATVSGGDLAACPLARLRDPREEGVHYHRSGGTKRKVYISEYITADYPLPAWQKLLQGSVGGSYNRYYLIQLEDNSWLCVYFDDYLLLTGAEVYPTGYLRYTTTEERVMLKQMAEDYDVDPVYVLDMYRYGKVSWILDGLLRFGVWLAAAAVLTLRGLLKKRKSTSPDK